MQEFTQSGYVKLLHVFIFIALSKLLTYEEAMSVFLSRFPDIVNAYHIIALHGGLK